MTKKKIIISWLLFIICFSVVICAVAYVRGDLKEVLVLSTTFSTSFLFLILLVLLVILGWFIGSPNILLRETLIFAAIFGLAFGVDGATSALILLSGVAFGTGYHGKAVWNCWTRIQ